jgi:hypothetical protein
MKIQSSKSYGFTVVEVVVALGLMSLGLIGLMSMMELQSKAERNALARSDYSNLILNLQSTLSIPTGCKANFADSAEPYTVSQRIDIKGGFFQANLQNGTRATPILKLHVPDKYGVIGQYGAATIREAYLDFPGFVAGQTIYQANLVLAVDKTVHKKDALGGQSFRVNPIPVVVMADPKTGLITGCNEPISSMQAALPVTSPTGKSTSAASSESEPQLDLLELYSKSLLANRVPSNSGQPTTQAMAPSRVQSPPTRSGSFQCTCNKGKVSSSAVSFDSLQTGACYPENFRSCLDPCVARSTQFQGNSEVAFKECTQICMGEWSCHSI